MEPLTIVDDGVTILNEKRTRITVDDGPTTTIKGTHLITVKIIDELVIARLRVANASRGGIGLRQQRNSAR